MIGLCFFIFFSDFFIVELVGLGIWFVLGVTLTPWFGGREVGGVSSFCSKFFNFLLLLDFLSKELSLDADGSEVIFVMHWVGVSWGTWIGSYTLISSRLLIYNGIS